MKRRSGFTLIELMIVVAIIGIIAAIAIPSIMQSRKAAQEASGSQVLGTIASAESTFRQNDGNRNQTQDYYTDSVWGLYAIEDPTGDPQKFIPNEAVANSDYVGTACGSSDVSGDSNQVPHNGFFVAAFDKGEAGNTLNEDLDGDGASCENATSFAFMAFPAEWGTTADNAYVVTQDAQVYSRDANEAGFNSNDGTPSTNKGTAPKTDLSALSFPDKWGAQ